MQIEVFCDLMALSECFPNFDPKDLLKLAFLRVSIALTVEFVPECEGNKIFRNVGKHLVTQCFIPEDPNVDRNSNLVFTD
jgi:hypothetical protein